MSQGKKNYLNFTNETPNDKGSVIPNEVIDFSRYQFNPVILRNHDWEAWSIGMMREIHFDTETKSWKGLPEFHGLNDESKLAKAMYEAGYLVSASIGGEMILKTTGEYEYKPNPETGETEKVPVLWRDENGYARAEKFFVYEISLPTLPANYMAITDEALEKGQKEVIRMGVLAASEKMQMKIFKAEEQEAVFSSIVTLAKKITDQKSTDMTKEEKEAQENEKKLAAEKAAKEEADRKAAEAAALEDKSNHVVLSSKIPPFIERLIEKRGVLGAIFGTLYKDPDDDDKPQSTDQPKNLVDQPGEEGKMSAQDKYEEAQKRVKACKEAYEKAETDEDKVKFKKELDEAEKYCKEAMEKAEAEAKAEEEAKKKAKEAADAEAKVKAEEAAKAEEKAKAEEAAKKEAEEAASKKKAEEEAKTKNSSNMKPERLSAEEIKKLGLEPAPEHQTRMAAKDGVTFSALRKDEKEGQQILGRVFSGTRSNEKPISDFAIILNSILADPKYREVAKQCRFHISNNQAMFEGQRLSLAANPNRKDVGISMKEVAARLSAGHTMGHELGNLTKKTTLSTDGVFSSLDTAAVEWLSLILYKLFPAEDWKNEIPVFGAQETGRNLGVIWTNIAANPTVYRGTTPAPAADYGPYSDTSVGMKLVNYWLEPMLWTPLSMHQLRYDQMGSGWIQGLAALNAQIGDDLLYTLTYGVYANKPALLVYTGGWPAAGSSASQTFNIPKSGSKFIFNSNFSGDLVKPGYNDIISLEEQFNLQNYDLSQERVVVVVDSSMMRYIKQDPETKSLLTRWINDQGAEILKISNTLLHERSRVAAFDPASTTVIDTHANGVSIPSTTQSAGLAFVASQVGIGLGLVDVFMIQDPTNYGYRMSCDLRVNARALRSDYTGLCMYTYNNGAQSGQ